RATCRSASTPRRSRPRSRSSSPSSAPRGRATWARSWPPPRRASQAGPTWVRSRRRSGRRSRASATRHRTQNRKDTTMQPTPRALAADAPGTGQIEQEGGAGAARAASRSVANNRPDFEGGPDQPTDAQLRAAAQAVGLEYRYLPVNGAWQSPEEIAAF